MPRVRTLRGETPPRLVLTVRHVSCYLETHGRGEVDVLTTFLQTRLAMFRELAAYVARVTLVYHVFS